MKAIKQASTKAFAVLMAAVLALGLAFAGLAAGTPASQAFAASNGKITVKNADSTATYTAYKIFDVTYTSDKTGYAYSISKDSGWLETIGAYIGTDDSTSNSGNFMESIEKQGTASGNGLTLTLSADGNNYVVTIDEDVFSAADFAEYLKKNIPTTETGTALTYDSDAKTASVSGLDLGYYFVTSSVGSLANLTTTNPEVVIYDKNEQPPFDKEANDVDVEIGQTVTYTITGKVPSTTGYTKYDYKVSDTLSSGLTFIKTVTVKFGDDVQTLTTVTDADATLTDGQIRYSDTGFELYFDMTKHQSDVGDVITITYSAVVNENAVVTTEGNPNNATLVYSNDPNESTSTDTETDVVKVYTVDLTIDKYAGGVTDDDGNTVKTTKLSGAEFVLVKKTTNEDGTTTESFYQATVYAYTYTDSSNETVTIYSKNGTDYYTDIACTETNKATIPEGTTPTKGAVADVSWVDSVDNATKVTTDDKGAATFDGLEAGTYYLRETKAPAGYNLLTSDQKVTITRTDGENNTVSITGNTAEVINNAGTELPSTGGIGTTIFYIIGGILVVGAAVLLITKRRMNGRD